MGTKVCSLVGVDTRSLLCGEQDMPAESFEPAPFEALCDERAGAATVLRGRRRSTVVRVYIYVSL